MKAIAQRLWMPVLAALSIAYLALMLAAGAPAERVHLVRYEANGVMAQKPELIVRARVSHAGQTVTFQRMKTGWTRVGDNSSLGEVLAKSLTLAIKFMHTAEPVRVLKASAVAADADAQFGLLQPVLSIRLEDRNSKVLDADFGSLSNDGLLHYMRIKGRTEFFLMSRFVLHEWQTVVGAQQ